MAKVIKRRENHVNKVTLKCRRCGSEIEFEGSERRTIMDRCEVVSYYECPVCRNWCYA